MTYERRETGTPTAQSFGCGKGRLEEDLLRDVETCALPAISERPEVLPVVIDNDEKLFVSQGSCCDQKHGHVLHAPRGPSTAVNIRSWRSLKARGSDLQNSEAPRPLKPLI